MPVQIRAGPSVIFLLFDSRELFVRYDIDNLRRLDLLHTPNVARSSLCCQGNDVGHPTQMRRTLDWTSPISRGPHHPRMSIVSLNLRTPFLRMTPLTPWGMAGHPGAAGVVASMPSSMSATSTKPASLIVFVSAGTISRI